MLDEFTCLISVSVNRRAGLMEAESCRASKGVSKPTIPHYSKKPVTTDSRIPLYLRSLRSTQFNRTAIVLTGLTGCLVHGHPAVPMSMARGVPRGQNPSHTRLKHMRAKEEKRYASPVLSRHYAPARGRIRRHNACLAQRLWATAARNRGACRRRKTNLARHGHGWQDRRGGSPLAVDRRHPDQ